MEILHYIEEEQDPITEKMNTTHFFSLSESTFMLAYSMEGCLMVVPEELRREIVQNNVHETLYLDYLDGETLLASFAEAHIKAKEVADKIIGRKHTQESVSELKATWSQVTLNA
jgi:hypothetical protein